MKTSGSTGTPFTNWQNADKKRHVNAEAIFYNAKAGYKIGRKLIFLRSVVKDVAKSRLQTFLQNIYMVDCADLSDEGIREKLQLIKRLSKDNGAVLLSYASTLDAFNRYFRKYGTRDIEGCRIDGIISGSEMLQDSTRAAMANAFGCMVWSRYSNEENGFIGQDDEINNVFIPNRANYYIEILKFDSDEQADLGELGRVVITDLYNYAMPMVRYDTGDVGAWQEVVVRGVRRLAIGNFGGRRVDIIYDCEGNPLSPHAVTNNMWKYPEINQFQFIQLDTAKYLLRLNIEKSIDEADVLATYHRIVGLDADISIEYCDEIPVLASGKRRYIENRMSKI